MRIYTTYTPSHENLYENYFLSTLPNDDGLELVVRQNPQECVSGSFYDEGWNQTCYRKIELFIEACRDCMGDVFIFSDVDVQFFGPIRQALIDELGDFDFAAQDDTLGCYCSGFFVCRANERTLTMFETMLANYEHEDQATLNRFVGMCKSKFLSHRFFTVAHAVGGGWQGQEFELPDGLLVHHGNWVVGVESKADLMNYVRRRYTGGYQRELYDLFTAWRPQPTYPTYPPYHVGPYLEDYLLEMFSSVDGVGGRYFIPVSWTTCYIQGPTGGLQEALDSLDQSKSYFALAQHDDAILEILPPNTKVYLCSGRDGGGIPVPLVCSPLPQRTSEVERDVFCSFVGSLTHEIRNELYETYRDDERFVFRCKNWSSSVPGDDLQEFINLSSRSVFSLAPRGYGRTSFRFFELMQLGSIPVFVYDEPWFPYEDEIDWDEFSIRIHQSDIPYLGSILSSYTEEEVETMRSRLYVRWQELFTMEAIHSWLLKDLCKKES